MSNAAAGGELAAAVVVTAVTYKLVKQPAEAAEDPKRVLHRRRGMAESALAARA